ncbi:MAG: 2-amino-4-ketopentanoate thiolase [Clostridiales bacterium]|nr:2-amino-4-ketopentanoate thiolase [Clostridiales bacterium]
MASKGDWVLLRSVVLRPGERAPQVPEDTARVPMMKWVKGWLTQDAQVGETARVRTLTGRAEEGELLTANPSYSHGFGDFVPALQQARESILAAFREGGPGDGR